MGIMYVLDMVNPEKIGGWQELVDNTISGPVRDQHTWTDLDGKKVRCTWYI